MKTLVFNNSFSIVFFIKVYLICYISKVFFLMSNYYVGLVVVVVRDSHRSWSLVVVTDGGHKWWQGVARVGHRKVGCQSSLLIVVELASGSWRWSASCSGRRWPTMAVSVGKGGGRCRQGRCWPQQHSRSEEDGF